MPRFPRRPSPANPGGASQAGLFGQNTLTGTVERIRFRAEDTGYTVLVILPEESETTVVVVTLPPGWGGAARTR